MSLENTHFGAEKIAAVLDGKKRLFFDGIGGVSMCSLAQISSLRGYDVSGYDRTETSATRELEKNGIKVFYDADGEHVKNCDALIYTVAIPADNPEYRAAISAGIPCISRADYLGYLMSGYKNRIGISGMHGKSTTTSMAEAVFSAAGFNPTVSCGASMKSIGSAYRIGGDSCFIFEACEYMDSFLDFYPTIAVILNIEMDHVDYFHSMAQIRSSFRAFLDRTNGGTALVNRGDEDVMEAVKGFGGTVVTFGVDIKEADYSALNISFREGVGSFDFCLHEVSLVRIELSVPGAHCICDALAAAAAAHLSGASPDAIARGLASFEGAARRMDNCGTAACGAKIYSDYAHHPTEIEATLKTACSMGAGRVFAVFQPHTYSRTGELFDGFVEALSQSNAEEIVIAPIYSARETDTYGISSEMLCDGVRDSGKKSRFIESFSDIADYINSVASNGDSVIVMGAGDITKVIPYMIRRRQ